MSDYDKETKFYWLQIKEDFFEDDAIDWLEEQENGTEYCLFYLKLCLKSLKSNGVLIRKVGDVLIPYDAKKLADLTKTKKDTVIVAMELLKQIGLIKILESGEIYMTQVEEMIGCKSKGAFKKQQQRALKKEKLSNYQKMLPENDNLSMENSKGGHLSPICPSEIEREIELELELEKEIERDNTDSSLTPVYDFFKNVITVNEFEELIGLYGKKEVIDKFNRRKEYLLSKHLKPNKQSYDTVKEWLETDKKKETNFDEYDYNKLDF